MKYTPEEIEKIKEDNKGLGEMLNIVPYIVMFMIGLTICGLWYYKHTLN